MKPLAAVLLLALAALGVQAAAGDDGDAALGPLLAAMAKAEAAGQPAQRWPAQAALARHLRAQGEPALAIYFGKQALTSIEALRAEPDAPERGALAERVAVYRELADLQAAEGRLGDALQTLQLLKEEEFFDFVQRESGWVDNTIHPELDNAEQGLDRRWAALPPPVRARSLFGDAVDADWIAGARAALREMAVTASQPVETLTPRAFAPATRAPSQTLKVSAIVGESHLTLVFETPSSVRSRQVVWPRADAAREVGAVLGALGNGQAALPQLQALYQRIGAPIAEVAGSVGARRIVMQGDDVLRYLPMAALHDGQVFLGERFSFVQQARPLDTSATRGLVPRVPVLQAVGVSRRLPGQPALPGVARELCAIVAGPVRGLADVDPACGGGGVVPGEGWLNEEFTARRFSEAMARASDSGGGAMLHVGTHFDLRPGQMAQSSLLLGDGTRMTLDAVARLDFRGHQLVTLSACDTGLGGGADRSGREVEGLSMLLIRRGARAVVASLWRVDDRSTSALMAAFYRELAQRDAAEALALAQQTVRSTPGWQSPFHWAGFYVTMRP